MAKRRTFDDILSADEAAFVKKEVAKKSTPNSKSKPKPKKKEEKSPMTKAALKREFLPESVPQPESSQQATAATMGSINARIAVEIATALMRASLDRRIQRLTPSTHREIVAEALSDWLKKHGYLT